jgi:hypothetical protein
MSIWPQNINTAFDLELSSLALAPAALFIELVLKAPTLGEEFLACRAGDDDSKVARLSVMRIDGRIAYFSEFCLSKDKILIAHITSSDCDPEQRARLCWERLEPLFSSIPPLGKSHISVMPLKPTKSPA